MVLSNSAMSDTIARYYFKVTLLDYLITSDTSIAYLLEAPMHYSYDKFDKINNKWVYSDYSGILARNNKDTYIPKGMSKREVSDLKIVMQDIVSYIIDGQPLIKNCQDFREMNIYLKKTNRLTVDTTQNSPKKWKDS